MKRITSRSIRSPNRPESYDTLDDLESTISAMEQEMAAAAKELAFERAALLRDRIKELKQQVGGESFLSG
jgi:excinuclease UvrABC helicase subunit UvrB